MKEVETIQAMAKAKTIEEKDKIYEDYQSRRLRADPFNPQGLKGRDRPYWDSQNWRGAPKHTHHYDIDVDELGGSCRCGDYARREQPWENW